MGWVWPVKNETPQETEKVNYLLIRYMAFGLGLSLKCSKLQDETAFLFCKILLAEQRIHAA